MSNRILFVVTSNDQLGETGEKTGLHYEELATPYYYLQAQGFEIDIASIKGGTAPIDPSSIETDAESVQKFKQDKSALAKLEDTKYIGDVLSEDYLAVYMPGGHGTMWDLPDNKLLIKTLEAFWADGKAIGSVCHGPAALVNLKDARGKYIVEGRKVSCFTDAEEKKIEKDDVIPFLLETKLKERGAKFENAGLFEAYSVRDRFLVTGQNPASARGVAEKLYDAIRESAAFKQAA